MTTTETTETGIDNTPAWRKVAFPDGPAEISPDRAHELLDDMDSATPEKVTAAITDVAGLRYWIKRDDFDEIQRRLFRGPRVPEWRRVPFEEGVRTVARDNLLSALVEQGIDEKRADEAIADVIGTEYWLNRELWDEIQRRLFDVPAAAEPKRISFPVEREEITRDFAFSLLFEGTGLAEDDINDALAEVLDGRVWLTPEKFGQVQDKLFAGKDGAADEPVYRFRQRLVGEGHTYEEIAWAFLALAVDGEVPSDLVLTAEDQASIRARLSGTPEAPKRIGIGASVIRGQLLTEGFTQDEVATAIGRAMEVTSQSGITDPVFTADEEAQIRANLCEAAGIPTDPRLMTIRLLTARRNLAEAQAAHRDAVRALSDFRATVREVAIREADRRGWCEEFDEILEEIGLEPRRNPRYQATLVIRVKFTAEASDRDRDVTDYWVDSCIQGENEIKDAIREYFSLDSDNMDDSLDIGSISFDVEDSEVIESAE